jgi:hypothetical protein
VPSEQWKSFVLVNIAVMLASVSLHAIDSILGTDLLGFSELAVLRVHYNLQVRVLNVLHMLTGDVAISGDAVGLAKQTPMVLKYD